MPDAEPRVKATRAPGFYRVRSEGIPGLAYLGQTGRSLFERTRSLASGVYQDADNPPWNDPHTAAPSLWAFRIEDGLEYEVSVMPADLDKPERQCSEDAMLYQHRLEYGHSTLCNHGRTNPWWDKPSSRKVGRAAKRRNIPNEYPSLPPAQGGDDHLSADWLGLDWSDFLPLGTPVQAIAGVYRIVRDGPLVVRSKTSN